VSFLLDTNVLSEGAKPRPDPKVMAWLASIEEERLFLSVVSLGELRHGIERLANGRRKAALDVWLTGELIPRFDQRLLLIDAGTADQWGRVVAKAQCWSADRRHGCICRRARSTASVDIGDAQYR